MVIYFKSMKALNHLLKHGIVYTLRHRFRKRICKWNDFRRVFECPVELVKTSRKSKPIAKAVVYFVSMVNINYKKDLEKYVEHSGFESVDEWINEYVRLNGNHLIAVLYKVKLVERVDK